MKIICFISFLLFAHFSNAQIITPRLFVESTYAIDSNSTWTATDLKQKKTQPFKQNSKINIGYNKDVAVWCIFKIKNTDTSQSMKTWLCFNNNHIDSLTLYDQQAVRTIGDRTTSRSPFIEALAFELDLKPNEERLLFARIKKETSFLEFSYSLKNGEYLESKSSQKTALVAFLIGMVFLLLMINGILFFITKNKLYGYYIIYSILTAIYATITTNFAKHVLFPQFRFFSEGRIYIGALWFIALSYFLCCFLQLKENQPKKHQLIKLLSGINFCLILISISLLIFYRGFDFKYLFMLGYTVFLISIIALFLSALTHLKIDKTQGTYALLAFLPQLIWGTCIILKTFEIIPKDLGDNWMVFISLYEVFLFGYVLSRNYIAISLKNSELMQLVISEKESSLKAISKVQLRERRNIANIIHDNVGSKLAHIIHLFDMQNTQLAKETINDLAEDIREISHKILPKALDEGALISALQSQIASLNAGLASTKIELFCYDCSEKIAEPWVYDLYLIALEIINNAIKHGKPKCITIEFYQYTDNYLFQFTDDGLGFDIQETSKGFGLENIEKRIDLYKGRFELSSIKNQGTVIQINIPTKTG